MSISLGILFGLISMLGYGLANAISKIPAQNIGIRKTIFFRNVFVSMILLIISLFYLKEINFSLKYILIAFAISFLGYVPLISFYKALKSGKVGIVAPIANSSAIYIILFSIVFFKETLTQSQLFSILLVLFGTILISINFNDFKNSYLFQASSGIPFALIASFLWGLVYFLFKIPVNVLGPILTSFIIEFGIAILCGMHLKLSKSDFKIPDKKNLTYIFFIAVFIAAGTLFYNLGISTYEVSIVAALAFASPLVTVIYSKFAYKEKLSLLQYLAVLLILAGVVLINYNTA